jgi:hypothetical protein
MHSKNLGDKSNKYIVTRPKYNKSVYTQKKKGGGCQEGGSRRSKRDREGRGEGGSVVRWAKAAKGQRFGKAWR